MDAGSRMVWIDRRRTNSEGQGGEKEGRRPRSHLNQASGAEPKEVVHESLKVREKRSFTGLEIENPIEI